jgi:nucleoside-diphosphate-sugar epimerase
MTPGEQIRDFVPVENVANAFVSALERTDLIPGKPKVENVGTGNPQTLRALAGHWWKQWGAKGTLKIGALPYRAGEVMRYVPQI